MKKDNNEVEVIISLDDFVKSSARTHGKSKESNRNPSAYTLLFTTGIPVHQFIHDNKHITRLKYRVYRRGLFLLSNNPGLLYCGEENWDLIINGKVKAGDVYIYEGSTDPAIHIHNLFYNEETRPITKSHSYWFGKDDNNKIYFCSLQGDSIKICES